MSKHTEVPLVTLSNTRKNCPKLPIGASRTVEAAVSYPVSSSGQGKKMGTGSEKTLLTGKYERI
ncbi:MAG: hypothetical protein PHV82_10775 [Victivallaceae bacterium]|nr:hypothetical protein [Victivallaceae bacterium]